MISAQVIKNTIEELRSITKIDFCVLDQEGSQVASTWEMTKGSLTQTMAQTWAALPR